MADGGMEGGKYSESSTVCVYWYRIYALEILQGCTSHQPSLVYHGILLHCITPTAAASSSLLWLFGSWGRGGESKRYPEGVGKGATSRIFEHLFLLFCALATC
jgi:hypothetical protein